MSTNYINIKGYLAANSGRNKYALESPISLGTYSQAQQVLREVAVLIVMRAPNSATGATARDFFSSHDQNWEGFRFMCQSNTLRAMWRTTESSDLTNLTPSNYVHDEELAYVCYSSKTLEQQTHWLNGELKGTRSLVDPIELRVPSDTNFQPFVGGINFDDIDIGVAAVFFWFENLPPLSELTDFRYGDAYTFTVPPTYGWTAIGNDGEPALKLTALNSSYADLNLVEGDLTNAAGKRPVFVGSSIDPQEELEINFNTVTALTASVVGTTDLVEGKVYFVVDTTDNLDVIPTAQNIRDGVLADGVTPALRASSTNVVSNNISANFSVPSNTAITVCAVQEDALGGLLEVKTDATITKKPVVVPAGADKKHYKEDNTVRVSEGGITLKTFDGYSQNGFSTNSAGEMSVDFTNYNNAGGGNLNIGDTISFVLEYSDGNGLYVKNATVTEG